MYIALSMSAFKNLYMNCIDKEMLGKCILKSSTSKSADVIISNIGKAVIGKEAKRLVGIYKNTKEDSPFSLSDNYVYNLIHLGLITADTAHANYKIHKEALRIKKEKITINTVIWHFHNRPKPNVPKKIVGKRKIGGSITQTEFEFEV